MESLAKRVMVDQDMISPSVVYGDGGEESSPFVLQEHNKMGNGNAHRCIPLCPLFEGRLEYV